MLFFFITHKKNDKPDSIVEPELDAPDSDNNLCLLGIFNNVPHETECNLFYKCLDVNRPLLLPCTDGFEFDFDAQTCVEISDHGCTANQQRRRIQ